MNAFVVDRPQTAALRALNYSPSIERIRRAGSSAARPLHEVVKLFGPGWRRAFARVPTRPGFGVELLSQSDAFAAEPRGRWIRADSMSEPWRHRIEPGQVLLAGTGTLAETELYGHAILADARLVGKFLTEDAMALVFEDPAHDFSLFTYAWLASQTGVMALRSTSYGTKMLRFRRDLLRSIPVPVPSADVVARVAGFVRTATKAREVYADALTAARRLVEQRWLSSDEVRDASNRRSMSVTVWDGALPTLRAWNFSSAGSLLECGRRRWGTTLRDWVVPHGVFMGGRVARIPCVPPYGLDLLSQRDVSLLRPVTRRIRRTTPALTVEPDWLLVASRGQTTEGALFGSIERAAHMPEGAAISGDIMRMVPREGLGPALFTFLATECGRRLLQSTAYGTSIPAMREDLLLDLPVPPPDPEWTTPVADLVGTLSNARVSAAHADHEAIRIVEEEVLPEWLK